MMGGVHGRSQRPAAICGPCWAACWAVTSGLYLFDVLQALQALGLLLLGLLLLQRLGRLRVLLWLGLGQRQLGQRLLLL